MLYLTWEFLALRSIVVSVFSRAAFVHIDVAGHKSHPLCGMYMFTPVPLIFPAFPFSSLEYRNSHTCVTSPFGSTFLSTATWKDSSTLCMHWQVNTKPTGALKVL